VREKKEPGSRKNWVGGALSLAAGGRSLLRGKVENMKGVRKKVREGKNIALKKGGGCSSNGESLMGAGRRVGKGSHVGE